MGDSSEGSGLDRRAFLRGAGGVALAAAVAPAFEPFEAGAGRGLPSYLRALQRAVRGQVLFRSSRGYGRARLVYNERFDGIRPLAVVRPRDVADIRATIEWGQRHGRRVVARSGGHSYAGYSTTGSGVVIDLSSLAGVRINGDGTATVGAGTQLIDVYARLAARGLTIPAGSCPTVGIGGLALGGGVGFASRRWGTTSDNLESLQLVTANGRVLTCDDRRNEDLYWASRGGGGGNFGIATNLRFQTRRARSASYFLISYPWGNASAALDAWQRFAPETTDDLFSAFVLSASGRSRTAAAFGQFFGSTSRLRRTLAPLLRVGGASYSAGSLPYMGIIRRWASCTDLSVPQCHLRADTPRGTLPRAAFDAKSAYVSRPLSSRGRGAAVSWIGRAGGVSGLSSGAIIFDAYGGAINRVPAGATAFAHRDELYSCQFAAYWSQGSAAGPSTRWLDRCYRAMRPYVSRAAYVNYIDADLPGWQQAYYGSNLDRLRQIKREVDPDDFFRFRQSIRPAG